MACSITTTFCKSPGEVLDYQFDWSSLLNSETVSTSTWSVSGLTIDSDTNTTTTTTAWISGGAIGGLYTVTNKIVTSSSRTIQRAFLINITRR